MSTNRRSLYVVHMLIVLLLMFGFGYLPAFSPITPLGMKIIGLFLGLLYGWTTVGLIWPSLIGMLALGLSGAMTTLNVLKEGFGSDTTLIILFLLIFAAIVDDSGLSKSIAMWIVTRPVFYGKPWLFTFSFLVMAFLLSAGTSTIGAIVLCWGILYMVVESLGYKPGDTYPAFMVITIVYACTLGLCLLPFKSVPLALLGVFSSLSGEAVSYVNYTAFTAPVCLLSLLVITLVGKFILRPDVTNLVNLNADTFKNTTVEKLNKKQKIVLGFFAALIILLFMPNILPAEFFLAKILSNIGATGTVVMLVAIMVMLHYEGKPLLNFRDMAAKGIQWDVVILTAMVMPLSNVIMADETGIKQFLAGYLMPLVSGMSSMVFCATVAVLAIVITNFFNNGVTGLIFITLTYDASISMGLNPTVVTILIIFCVHLALLTPAASPMAALLHSNRTWAPTSLIYKYGALSIIVTAVFLLIVGVPLANAIF